MKQRSATIVAIFGDDCDVLPKQMPSDVRVVLVSDTHNVEICSSLFPPGDLLLHAGDHTCNGTKDELYSASKWLEKVAALYPYGCLTVGGNHDLPLDVDTYEQCEDWDHTLAFSSTEHVTLLQHQVITVGGLVIFGSPFVSLTPSRLKKPQGDPARYYGFNREESTLATLYSKIPPNVDILMTHSPPQGLLDASLQYGGELREAPISIGSKSLREWIDAAPARPALHVFGHEHDSRGLLVDSVLGCVFCNAAAVNGDRKVGSYELKPKFRATVVDFRLSSAE